MAKNIKDLKKDECIHCPTPEIAEKISKLAELDSRFWGTYWDTYKEEYCIYPEEKVYGSLSYARKQNYTVYEASEFLEQENITLKDMIKGEYYTTKWDNNIMIYIFDSQYGNDPECCNYKYLLSNWDKKFSEKKYCFIGEPRINTVSTSEERKWLDACIEADKFVFFEKANTKITQFEIGKWYTFNNPDYPEGICCAKFKKLSDDDKFWYFSEYIGNGKYKKYNGNWNASKCTGNLTDLSEIQQYLPENHPDEVKSMFKKGDYIVTLNTPKNDNSFPRNFIFKQRECEDYLLPELDNEGSKTNGWILIDSLKKREYGNWRYGTPEEIAEYERLGKPYDVTTLIKKETITEEWIPKVEDWIKLINKNYHNSSSKWYRYDECFENKDIGSVIQILDISEEDGGAYKVKTPKGYTALRRGAFKKTSSNEIPKLSTVNQLIEEAKRHYPIGTIVKSLDALYKDQEMTVGSFDHSIQNEEEIYFSSGELNPCVYYKGKWAEIVSSPSSTSEETIEVGDEVLTERGNGVVIAILKDDEAYLVKGANGSHDRYPEESKNRLVVGQFSNKKDSWCYYLSELKLIKKASSSKKSTKNTSLLQQKSGSISDLIKIRERTPENKPQRVRLSLTKTKTINHLIKIKN